MLHRVKFLRKIHDTLHSIYIFMKGVSFSIYFKILVIIICWFELDIEIRRKIWKNIKKVLKHLFTFFIFFDKSKTIRERFFIKRITKLNVAKFFFLDIYIYINSNLRLVIKYWRYQDTENLFWNLFYLYLCWIFFFLIDYSHIINNYRINLNEQKWLMDYYNSIPRKKIKPKRVRVYFFWWKTIPAPLMNETRFKVPMYWFVDYNDWVRFISNRHIVGSMLKKFEIQYDIYFNFHNKKYWNFLNTLYYIYIYYYVLGIWVYNNYVLPELIGMYYKTIDRYFWIGSDDWKSIKTLRINFKFENELENQLNFIPFKYIYMQHGDDLEFKKKLWGFNLDIKFIIKSLNVLFHMNRGFIRLFWFGYKTTKVVPITSVEYELDEHEYEINKKKSEIGYIKYTELVNKNKLKNRWPLKNLLNIFKK